MSYMRSFLCTLTHCVLLFSLAGCSPGYVLRAAWEQSKILACREPIAEVLVDPDTLPSEAQKLRLVLDARDFAKSLGLDPGGSFLSYTRLDRSEVSWIVMAARKDSFTPVAWWFPIVGSVPYKGFFDREDADALARELEAEGYETWVRGTDAYSTLGWFDDPLLSTTLSRTPLSLVNTVLHESTHSTVWIPYHADFNESLANFIGHIGAIQFAQAHPHAPFSALDATRDWDKEKVFAAALHAMVEDLSSLYDSKASTEEKLTQREAIFDRHVIPLRARFPKMTILSKINNAEIMQLVIYLKELETYERLYEALGRSMPKLLDVMREIGETIREKDTENQFTLMTSRLPPK